VGDALDALAALGGVEVGVEDAAAAAILELEARAFADLEAGGAEQLAELGHGEAEETAVLVGALAGWGGSGDGGRGLTSAGGEEEGEGGGEAAHAALASRCARLCHRPPPANRRASFVRRIYP